MSSGWRLIAKPFLAVEEIEVNGSQVRLSANGRGLALDSGSDADALELAQFLTSMRAPDAPLWADQSLVTSMDPLLRQLDQNGLLSEGASPDQHRDRHEAERDRSVAALAAWFAEARAHCGPEVTACLRAWASRALAPTQEASDAENNLFAWALEQMTIYWNRSAPTVIGTALTALERAGVTEGYELPERYIHDPLSDLAAISAELDAFATVSLLAAIKRVAVAAPTCEGSLTGAGLALGVEQAAYAYLTNRPSNLPGAAQHGSIRLARGIYVEQFHLSSRFVEAICPLLERRSNAISDPPSSSTTRRRLATRSWRPPPARPWVSPGTNSRSIPLPTWVAYIDALIAMAGTSPVSFLASILVAEGLPGSRPAVADLLADSGLLGEVSQTAGVHDQLNVDLDHTYLSRRLLSRCRAIPAADADEALLGVAMMLELNRWAWSLAAWFYGPPAGPQTHTWLGLRPRDIVVFAQSSSDGKGVLG